MDLLEHLKMSLLNFNFAVTYIIHKMLLLLKNRINYLKDSIFELLFFKKKKMFFSQQIMMESLSLEEKEIIKDIRNLYRQEKETKAKK